MGYFFYDEEKEYDENEIELYYLSNTISYGININEKNNDRYFDSNGLLKNSDNKEESDKGFTESDFRRLISEKIHKIVYGEKFSNIVFLAGAGASVVKDRPEYGKTVRMIANNIYKNLEKSDNLFGFVNLAKKCQYNNGEILDDDNKQLNEAFNLENFLSKLFQYRPFVSNDDKDKFEKSIKEILQQIKNNTNYSYNSKYLKHGALLNFLSDLSAKEGNKFSVITTNYDDLIEKAAVDNNFVVFDGFNFTEPPKFDSTMFEWNLVKEVNYINTREVEFKEKTFNLIKIHGSLTWEKQENGNILRKNKDNIRDIDSTVMIFPSSDKFAQSYQEPYFELFTKFQDLIKRPNTLLITSGFSFADEHISKMITQALKNTSSLKLLITDYNINPNKERNEGEKKFYKIEENDSRYNHNWAEMERLMKEGYSVTFLKATMNDNLVDYLSGRYLNDKN
ncbi:SIR2 family protein [Staphylococcus chromogenes]|uniref:SIR2 family protein n=1 Tax=Staphylococcus borealis TaxID=2742203 RepID=UPI002A835F54|nr:SIR2 family protein [Staphylococcus borealis]MDY4021499.1 SIR2 family protein [Staphylococcus borealis]